MLALPAYSSILDVAYAWHGVAVPTKIGSALPPVVRLRVTMLLRAVLDARLAVYEPATRVSFAIDTSRAENNAIEEVDGTPRALAEMNASGDYVPQVLAHYRLCINELYVWAIGEDLVPPPFCTPSWVRVERSAALAQPRKMRPETDEQTPARSPGNPDIW